MHGTPAVPTRCNHPRWYYNIISASSIKIKAWSSVSGMYVYYPYIPLTLDPRRGSRYTSDTPTFYQNTTYNIQSYHSHFIPEGVTKASQILLRDAHVLPKWLPKHVCMNMSVCIGSGSCFYLQYIHSYHSRFIPKGVTEASQILLRDAHVLPKLFTNQ
jgi:hypothetical protein